MQVGRCRLLAQHGLAERIATGHYARVTQRGGQWLLLRGADRSKDQSYFLHQLGQQALCARREPPGVYGYRKKIFYRKYRKRNILRSAPGNSGDENSELVFQNLGRIFFNKAPKVRKIILLLHISDRYMTR